MTHQIVSHEEWLKARKAFLEKEKAFTKAREDLARERRELPWVRIDKAYSFEGPEGRLARNRPHRPRSIGTVAYDRRRGPPARAHRYLHR